MSMRSGLALPSIYEADDGIDVLSTFSPEIISSATVIMILTGALTVNAKATAVLGNPTRCAGGRPLPALPAASD